MAPRVLIIDAESEFAGQLAETLTAAGVEALTAADGKVGLDLAKSKQPSAIVVCVELPRMSGYSVCTKLRKDESLKAVPVIITSSAATPETFESHSRLSTRADEYLKKPFPPAMLLDVLRPYLGGPVGEPEPIDGAAIDIVDEVEPRPPQAGGSLSFDGAFGLHETTPFEGGAAGLASRAAVSAEPIDEAEALTTVGLLESTQRPAPARPVTKKSVLGSSETRRVETLRPVTRTEEPAPEVPMEARASSLPVQSTAPTSREVLELKRERNAKEKELHALKEQLNEREKELIAWRDKETEFETEIVQLQEGMQEAQAARHEAETKATELQRSLGQTLADLRRRLSESNSREADLDSTVQALQQDLEGARQQIAEREQVGVALTTERDELARQLGETTEALRKVERHEREARQALKNTQGDLEQTRDSLAEITAEGEAKSAEIERLAGELESKSSEAEDLRRERDLGIAEQDRLNQNIEELINEQSRLTNELSAASAEAEGLRDQLRARDDAVENLDRRVAELERQLEAERNEREALRAAMEELNGERERNEEQLEGAFQRIREDEGIRAKAVQALEIAVALLKEAGFAAPDAVVEADSEEARS